MWQSQLPWFPYMKIQIFQISVDSSLLCLQQLLQSLPEMVSWHVPYSAAMRIKYCWQPLEYKKTLPSYFSWSFTTIPMILELFLASKMPAIFGIYPDLSSFCWTRFTVLSEIFSVFPWITFETVEVLRPNTSATSTIRILFRANQRSDWHGSEQ